MMATNIQDKNFMTPIANHEQRYTINKHAEILNLANNKLKKHTLNSNGYYKVGLADGCGGHTQYSIHRLVAMHFIPNPHNHPQVNHIDGDKSNNDITNLEWCTREKNIQHSLRTGLRKGYMSAMDKELYLQDILGGKSIKVLAEEINRQPNSLSKMLRETAKRVNLTVEWNLVMKENRRNAAIRNLKKINTQYKCKRLF